MAHSKIEVGLLQGRIEIDREEGNSESLGDRHKDLYRKRK